MRKCRRKSCRKELPSKADSDKWQSAGFCDVDCMAGHGYDKAMEQRQRTEKQSRAKSRDRLKTRTEWLNEAQAVFNQYIRLRDAKLPCVSCGIKTSDVQYHAGHYRTRKAAPQLRFDEKQVFKQCATCNNHLSGNLINYRRELLMRIGEAELDRIESDNSQSTWTIDDAKRIKAEYKDKIKHLQRQQ